MHEGVQVRFLHRGPFGPLVEVLLRVRGATAPAGQGRVHWLIEKGLDRHSVFVGGEVGGEIFFGEEKGLSGEEGLWQVDGTLDRHGPLDSGFFVSGGKESGVEVFFGEEECLWRVDGTLDCGLFVSGGEDSGAVDIRMRFCLCGIRSRHLSGLGLFRRRVERFPPQLEEVCHGFELLLLVCPLPPFPEGGLDFDLLLLH
tara:strand:- start:32 stop:628 length:597 start_codon:yes stop_codon:yes gene_type:complete